ncbi:MAG: hypothetical protein ACR2JH_04845 [Solirubrobacteraceae bacterium]
MPEATLWFRRSPFLLAAVACLALAALSAALVATVPSYDPWSWIVWGREVSDPHLSFAVGGGPSWKPLPFLFTTVYGMFGAAAPTLWVITARAGGLLGVVAGYRLGSLLAARPGRGARWMPVLAGVVATLGIVLTQEWSYYMFRGTSEPMLLGAALWAVDRHLAGRHWEAFVLGLAAALIRPEAWPFIILYAAWLWLRQPRSATRILILLGLAAIPFLWFVPPWIGSGQPFLAASHAKAYNGHLGSSPFLEVMRRGADLQVIPWLAFGLAAVAIGWFRGRDRLILGLAAAAAGWWVLVVAMTLAGYPGLERFFLPAAGLTCVLGGVGFVQVAELLSRPVAARWRSSSGQWALGAAALILLAISIPFITTRVDEARAQPAIADRAVTRLDQLSAAVKAAGGHAAVFPCRSSFAAVNHGVQTALAFKLHTTLARVGTSMRHQGVMFVGPHDTIDGGPAPVNPLLDQRQLVAQAGVWRVYRVWRQGHLNSCVGR